jgi:hypothetical protein
VWTSSTKNTYSVRSHAVSTVKKSAARIPVAWWRKNSAHVGALRRGAGPRPSRRRSVRIAVAETVIPSLASSPLIRRHPQRGFSRPIRRMRSRTSSTIGWPPAEGPAGVSPLPAYQLTVPTKEGLRTDQESRPARTRECPAHRCQEQPIPAAKSRPAHLSPEDGQLMAKDENLDVVLPAVRRTCRKDDQTAQK